jgi:dihydrodipicolinate synthase/N-acetylneuraminate lyase
MSFFLERTEKMPKSKTAKSKKSVFHGCIPAVMTPCSKTGKINFEKLVAKSHELVAKGMSAVVSVGSMGNWVDVSLQDRLKCVEEQVKAKIPVIVGTGAQSTRDAVKIAEHAADVGAAGLMIIPKQLYRVSSIAAQEAHFAAVLKSGLPSVVYNSPYYGYQMGAEQFFRLMDKFSNLIGFKEFGGKEALTRDAQTITSGNKKLSLLVGVDTQVVHGFVHCGAVGAITGIGNVQPTQVLRLIELSRKASLGDQTSLALAMQLDNALSELSKFDEGIDLVLYYKYLLFLLGEKEYKYHIEPTDKLSTPQKEFAKNALKQFQNWWDTWNGKE